MEIVWYTAMSMDGRIAGNGDDLSFLESIANRDEALAAFPKFLASVDGAILGGGTLRWLLQEDHGWPHGDLPTWVVTHDAALLDAVGKTAAPMRRIEGDLGVMLREMEAAGVTRAWLCGGGDIAGQLLALGRVDEIEVTIAPMVLGAGPALFGERPIDAPPFELVECGAFAGNAVRARWRRKRT